MAIARRKFLGQAAAAASLPLLPRSLFAAAPPAPLVRYNVLSVPGQAMVKKYAKAVAIMKSKPAKDPCSWIFQWYTHAIPVPQATAIQQVFGSTPSPERDLALAAWYTCQPHQSGQDTDNFLPWHRMFVYWFEQMIRATLHDPTFTLPYWNYSPGLPTNTHSGIMPQAFRSASDPSLASLFVANRNAGVNTGSSIDTGNPGLLDATSALAEHTYRPHAPLQGFCNNLDFNLHGNVHGLIGTSTNMGYVPTAGQDPIFWMHHCNIDRLWASWNKAGNANPNDAAFLSQKFTFAGPDCKLRTMAVSEVLDIAKLNYTYQEFEPAPRPLPQLPHVFDALTAKSPVTSGTPVASAAKVALTGASTTTALGSTSPAKTHLFDLTLAPPAPRIGRYYLVIKDLQISKQPGVVYQLFLNLPAGASPAVRSAHFVGSLNFFSAMPGMSMDADDRFISFDLTAFLKSSGDSVNGPLTLTIAPRGEPDADAAPIIGSVSVVQL